MKGELGFFSDWSFGVVFLSEKETNIRCTRRRVLLLGDRRCGWHRLRDMMLV